MEILNVENLSFSYPERKKKAIDNVSFKINRGEFVLLCGESGCGKTTLLRLLKREIAPHGDLTGKIYLDGIDIEQISDRDSVSKIGFVMQNPEQQLVTEKVWRELAFGLESLGLESSVIRRKTAETASYFGLEKLYRSDTSNLSGGEKQLLNLASVMAMNPSVLILDEPTSQLDPITAREFISTLSRLNREWGVTVIMSEHRTEELFAVADRVLAMENGKIILDSSPKKTGVKLKNHKLSIGFPTSVRLYGLLGFENESDCPLSVRDGRNFILDKIKTDKKALPIKEYKHSDECAIELKDVSFRYSQNGRDVLSGANLKIYSGEVYSLLGGNGAGKSTLLKTLSGMLKPYSGKINILGRSVKKYRSNSLYKNTLAMLPQNPQELFIKSSVADDFREIKEVMEMTEDEFSEKLKKLCELFEIDGLLDSHPYDLSGGEQQKAALVKVLLLNPKILLLDEPTKGMDAYSKGSVLKIVKTLKDCGITVLTVTHDVEFAAMCSDRCGLFFDGEVVSEDIPREFFSQNTYYTTAAAKLSKGIFENTVTCEQLYEICKINGVR